jgi:hypothetical protein
VTSQKLSAGFDEALAELRRRGLLLVHDSAFPSLTRLTIGQPIRGSWWAHPLSNDVYMVSPRLQHCGEGCHDQAGIRKGNLPASAVVATAGCDRNFARTVATRRFAGSASAILAEVDRLESIRMDLFSSSRPRKEIGEDALSLARRLLVYADDVHTESGAHVRRLESWPSWARRHELALESLPSADEARRELERIVDTSNAECSSEGFLPWRKKGRTRIVPRPRRKVRAVSKSL